MEHTPKCARVTHIGGVCNCGAENIRPLQTNVRQLMSRYQLIEETEGLVIRVNKLFNRFNRFKAARLYGQNSHVLTIPDDWLEEVRELLRSIETEKPQGVLDNLHDGTHPKEEGV